MFAPEDVLALEMIILRLHMQTPVPAVAPPQPPASNGMIPQHQHSSPVSHTIHMGPGGQGLGVNGAGNPSVGRNGNRR